MGTAGQEDVLGPCGWAWRGFTLVFDPRQKGSEAPHSLKPSFQTRDGDTPIPGESTPRKVRGHGPTQVGGAFLGSHIQPGKLH